MRVSPFTEHPEDLGESAYAPRVFQPLGALGAMPLTCKSSAERRPIVDASWEDYLVAERCERGLVRGPGPGGVAVLHKQDGAAPGTRGGRSGHRIPSGSRSPSCASRRRARPLSVAERAQPPAMLRAPWPRGLNLAAARDPTGLGGDGECGRAAPGAGLGQGWAGDFQKPSLQRISWGVQPGDGLPGCPVCLLRAGGMSPRGC